MKGANNHTVKGGIGNFFKEKIFNKQVWKDRGTKIKDSLVTTNATTGKAKLTGGGTALAITAAVAGAVMIGKAIYDVSKQEEKAAA
jgi:hypothetical protein